MIFTSPSFFEFEPIKISNITNMGNVAIDFARFIGTYEKKCLTEVLGACLYEELMASYTFTDGAFALNEDATQPIKNLVNGKQYTAPVQDDEFCFDFPIFGLGCGCGCGTDNCTQRYWKGIVQSDEFLNGAALGQAKRSFIADYIYYHYLLVNRSVTAGSGQQVVEGENSKTVQNFSKRIDRYNEFIFSVVGARRGETSLYRFLNDNKADYPTWSPNCNLNFKDKW